jgi:hypothetical protein
MTREILTNEAFFEIAKRQKVDVPFPESGNGAVIPFWGMTPTERTRFEKQFQKSAKGVNRESLLEEFRERVVAECCRNDEGVRIFQREDVQRLGASSGALVERLFNVAGRASGITETDIEETVKNSEATTVGS